MSKLDHHIQKTIFVSIPGLAGDDRARPYKLIGIDSFGLWLESESFATDLSPPESMRQAEGPRSALVPFARIAYVLCEEPLDPSAARRAAEQASSEASHRSPRETED